MSSSARLRQLGIFASVGATPKQIKISLVMEALLLTAIPLPVGTCLGQFAMKMFINYSNSLGGKSDRQPMVFMVGWQSLLPALVLTLVTVWWSALIPARKIAKMAPIVAIRQDGGEKLKKLGRFSMARLGELFGFPGELAANALQARKKSYRTATISLTLSLLTLICFVCTNSASTASVAIYKSDEKQWEGQDILLSLNNVAAPEDYDIIRKQVVDIDGIKSTSWYNTLRTVAWLGEDQFSDEFEEKGGFQAIEKEISEARVPLLRDGKRRVGISILGLDDETFATYCAEMGIDPKQFYEEDKWRSILYNTVNDVVVGTERNPVPIPFIKAQPGDIITQTETTIDSYEGDFTFDMEIVAIADKLPPIGSATFNVRYSAIQIMPMNQAKSLASNFARSNIVKVSSVIQVSDASLITPIRTKIEETCESYFGSGDYNILDENEYYEESQSGRRTSAVMFAFIVVVLGVIGFSNSWSIVRGTLNARRREFAMLRSVGLPPNGLKKNAFIGSCFIGNNADYIKLTRTDNCTRDIPQY